MYYEVDSGHWIASFGNVYSTDAREITEERYTKLKECFRFCPPSTEGTDYRLNIDIEWEAVPPDTDPEIDDAELLNILMGGAE